MLFVRFKESLPVNSNLGLCRHFFISDATKLPCLLASEFSRIGARGFLLWGSSEDSKYMGLRGLLSKFTGISFPRRLASSQDVASLSAIALPDKKRIWDEIFAIRTVLGVTVCGRSV
jgi:hypothetical protein